MMKESPAHSPAGLQIRLQCSFRQHANCTRAVPPWKSNCLDTKGAVVSPIIREHTNMLSCTLLQDCSPWSLMLGWGIQCVVACSPVAGGGGALHMFFVTLR